MEFWYEFELLKYIGGQPYAGQRNRLLQSPAGLENRLLPYASDKDWRTAITAHILLGYLRHQGPIASLMKTLKEQNLDRARESAAGMGPVYEKYRLMARNHGQAILPYAWEMLLKFDSESEGWKLIAMTHMIGAVPHPLSAETLIRFIENTEKEGPRNAAAAALVRLADAGVLARVAKTRARHEAVADLLAQVGEEAKAAKSGPKSGSEKEGE